MYVSVLLPPHVTFAYVFPFLSTEQLFKADLATKRSQNYYVKPSTSRLLPKILFNGSTVMPTTPFRFGFITLT